MKDFQNNIKKHISILKLVRNLKKYRKKYKINISDYWKADLCAIGLKKKHIIMYISTNNYVQKNFLLNANQLYDCDVECVKSSLDDYFTIKSYRGISFLVLLKILKKFYNLKP